MQVSAMSSAVTGMRRASALLDSAAAAVADDTASSAPEAVPSPVGSPPPASLPRGDDGLLTAIPDLLVARTMFGANAAVARTAQETYQAALDLVRPTT